MSFLPELDPLLGASQQHSQFVNLTDPQAELLDPSPDLHAMFVAFDYQFFNGTLGRCVIEWSKRMKTYVLLFILFLFDAAMAPYSGARAFAIIIDKAAYVQFA